MVDRVFHIVTTGGYGYNDVGDEAMPRTLLINLKAKFKDRIRFTMLSPQPDFTEYYHGEKAVLDIFFLSQSVDDMNAERTIILNLARRYNKNPMWTKFLIKKGLSKANKKWYSQCLELFELLKSADALLNVGGGNLNSIMLKELYKKTTLYEICKIFNKYVFVSGQSLGPYYSDNDKAIVRESLRKIDVLTFRDKGFSFKRIQAIGLVKNNYNKLPLMYDAGDDAMSMPQESKEKVLFYLGRDTPEEWKNHDAKYVWALNLKASLNSFKGKGRSKDLDAEVDLLVKISEYVLKNFSSKILLIPTDYCEGVDDRIYHKRIVDKISHDLKHRIYSMEKVYTDFELKGLISECDFALGARYHFHVFSLSAKVPSIGIASGEYQQAKLKGIYSLLDLREFYIHQDMEFAKLEDVTVVIDKLVNQREKVKKKLDENVEPLIINSKKIVDIIYKKLTMGYLDEKSFSEQTKKSSKQKINELSDNSLKILQDSRKINAYGRLEAVKKAKILSLKQYQNSDDLLKLNAKLEIQMDNVKKMKNKADIKASVIIPTLNHARSLQIALKSILAQDFPSTGFEILVIDNGSNNDTRTVTEMALMKNSSYNIKYIRESTPGLLSGRHRGANEAEGNILVFVDDDIEATPGWLSAIVSTFDNTSIDLVGGPSMPRYEVQPPNWMTRYFHNRQGKVVCGSLSLFYIGNKTIKIDPTFVWGLNFSLRKETLLALGGFHPDGVPEHMLHFRGDGETGLTLKIRNQGMSAVYVPQAMVYHHIPKERLTVQYFEKRHYSQGISDSYTQVRQNRGLINIKIPQYEADSQNLTGLLAHEQYKQHIYRKIHKAYVDGFQFHQEAVKNNETLLEWVLREDYFDYKLPLIAETSSNLLKNDRKQQSNSNLKHNIVRQFDSNITISAK